jgi:outer membrane protein OmpA-like peptidoglycan-associated protein
MTRIARAAVLSLLAACLVCVCLPAAHAAAEAGEGTDESPTLVVYFDEWSGKLDHAALDVIAHAARRARHQHAAHITVAGYADDTGSQLANIALTQLRAQQVADVLEKDGIPAAAITMKAEGAQKVPGVASRRVEITLSGE